MWFTDHHIRTPDTSPDTICESGSLARKQHARVTTICNTLSIERKRNEQVCGNWSVYYIGSFLMQ